MGEIIARRVPANLNLQSVHTKSETESSGALSVASHSNLDIQSATRKGKQRSLTTGLTNADLGNCPSDSTLYVPNADENQLEVITTNMRQVSKFVAGVFVARESPLLELDSVWAKLGVAFFP